MPIPTLAILGGGASGSLTAAHLLRAATFPLRVVLVEPTPGVGAGVAYSTADRAHLLNVRVDNMSAWPDAPDHFLEWLQQRRRADVPRESFVPRTEYGAYLRSVLDQAFAHAARGVRLEIQHGAAVDVTPAEHGLRVHLDIGVQFDAQHAILALGNLPPSDPTARLRGGPCQRLISGHDWRTIRQIPASAPVLIVGSGLTMVDVALSLDNAGHDAQIDVLSRHGLVPLAHRPRQAYPGRWQIETAPRSIRGLLHAVRHEVQLATSLGYAWPAVIDALRPITQSLWQSLPRAEQARFLRHVRTYWDIHRHRISPENAQQIADLRESGQLRVRAGHLTACRESAQSARLWFRPRGWQRELHLDVARVINCTGPSGNYTAHPDPLIARLRQQGWLQNDPLGLGIAADGDGRLLDQDGSASPFLSTLGPPLKGVLWECTAIPDIRVQASRLARRLLGALEASAPSVASRA